MKSWQQSHFMTLINLRNVGGVVWWQLKKLFKTKHTNPSKRGVFWWLENKRVQTSECTNHQSANSRSVSLRIRRTARHGDSTKEIHERNGQTISGRNSTRETASGGMDDRIRHQRGAVRDGHISYGTRHRERQRCWHTNGTGTRVKYLAP